MKRKSVSISQFQKQQITQQTFKRNRQYLDLCRISQEQKIFEIRRRKPHLFEGSPKSKKVNEKISYNFRNSVQNLNQKVGDEMKKFKSRVSPSYLDKHRGSFQKGPQTARSTFYNPQQSQQIFHKLSQTFPEPQHPTYNYNQESDSSFFTQTPSKSTKKIKGIPISKQLTRDYLYQYKILKNNVIDERNFNNYSLTKNDLSKTQDFNKLLPRNISFENKNINDLDYKDTQKLYEKYYYSTDPMKAKFRYSIQNKKEGRKFFIPPRAQNIPKTHLDPEKIRKSFSQASNFKPNKIDSFYKMTGRNLPHQLDQRNLSPNCNFYKDKEGKIIIEKVDYFVKKLHDDVVRKQKAQQFKKKNPQFTRDQICDQKYFKEMIKRQNKMDLLQRIL